MGLQAQVSSVLQKWKNDNIKASIQIRSSIWATP